MQTKQNVIYWYLNKITTTVIDQILRIIRITVNEIIKLFKKTEKTKADKKVSNRRTILSLKRKTYIRDLLNAKLLITLNATVLKTEETFHFSIVDNTFDKCLKQFHYSLKQIVMPPMSKL
ncbi:hypothetical protein CDIK_0615 [Cucumispora dikerogammari]|nr:hypothetical protein CDIK_0615 [Cucumispora dikerogammari]